MHEGLLSGASLGTFDGRVRAQRLTSLESIVASTPDSMTSTDRDRAADRAAGAYISAGMFAFVGARPMLGRDFRADDDRPGAQPVAIVGASVWKNRYGSDPAIIGRSIDHGERRAASWRRAAR